MVVDRFDLIIGMPSSSELIQPGVGVSALKG